VPIIQDWIWRARFPRRLIIIAFASTTVTAAAALAAEEWAIAGQGGTCTYASDVAVRAGEPAFASPFLIERLGATIKVNRSQVSGSIVTVDVILGPDSHILFFPSMRDCNTAVELSHTR
jgi:hypothetical protein